MEGVADMIVGWVWWAWLSGRCGRYDRWVGVVGMVECKVWQIRLLGGFGVWLSGGVWWMCVW